MYDGYWKDGKRHGRGDIFTIIYTVIGILRYPSGASKEGEWRDDMGNGNMVYT